MRNLRLIWGILHMLCFVQIFAVNPSIRVNITAEGLEDMKQIIEPIVWSYVQNMEPIQFPDQTQERFDFTATLTNMELYNLSYTGFDMQLIPSEQVIQMSLVGLSGSLFYNCSFDITFPPLSENWTAIANFSDTHLILSWVLDKRDSGQISLKISNSDMEIGTLDLGVPGKIGSFLADLSFIVDDIIDSSFDSTVPPTINNILAETLNSIPVIFYLDPENLTLIDMSLISKPDIDQKGIGINFKGDIRALISGPCPYVPNVMSHVSEGSIRLYASETLFRCAIEAYGKSGLINDIVDAALQDFLQLDSRMRLFLQFDDTSNAKIDENGVDAQLNFALDLDYPVGKSWTPYIEFQVQTNVELIPAFIKDKKTKNLNLTMTIADFVLGLGVNNYSTIMPEKYKLQINQTNFAQLSAQATNFLANSVIPNEVNPILKKTGFFSLPAIYAQFSKNQDISLHDGFLVASADIKTPLTENERIQNYEHVLKQRSIHIV